MHYRQWFLKSLEQHRIAKYFLCINHPYKWPFFFLHMHLKCLKYFLKGSELTNYGFDFARLRTIKKKILMNFKNAFDFTFKII